MLLELIALISGLISAICWLIGDIALVGYDIKRQKYKTFADRLHIKHRNGAIFMLEGSERKLYSGSMIAFFSSPLLIFSVYGLYSLTSKDILSVISISFIAAGFILSPPAHIAFYYCGTLSKALYEEFLNNKVINKSYEILLDNYQKKLDILWVSAVSSTYLGWIIYSVSLYLTNSHFRGWYMLFSPPIMTIICIIATAKIKVFKPSLNGAGLNMALIIWFVFLIVLFSSS